MTLDKVAKAASVNGPKENSKDWARPWSIPKLAHQGYENKSKTNANSSHPGRKIIKRMLCGKPIQGFVLRMRK